MQLKQNFGSNKLKITLLSGRLPLSNYKQPKNEMHNDKHSISAERKNES